MPDVDGPAPAATPEPGRVPDDPAEVIARFIPFRNPAGVLAWYVGVLGCIPAVGLVLGLAAVVLGILGLRAARRDPAVRGAYHSWAGLALGMLAIVGNLMLIALALGGRIPTS